MNETAKDIIEFLKTGMDKDNIVSAIAQKYNINENDAFIDVSDFLSKLKIYGIIK
jgi:hypothetical protein